MTPYAPSLMGKSNLQLHLEMDVIFDTNKINARTSFEKKRSRITLVLENIDHKQQAFDLLLKEHPTFHFSYENGNVGKTSFYVFKEFM